MKPFLKENWEKRLKYSNYTRTILKISGNKSTVKNSYSNLLRWNPRKLILFIWMWRFQRATCFITWMYHKAFLTENDTSILGTWMIMHFW